MSSENSINGEERGGGEGGMGRSSVVGPYAPLRKSGVIRTYVLYLAFESSSRVRIEDRLDNSLWWFSGWERSGLEGGTYLTIRV